MTDTGDLAVLARHALGHATRDDWGRILRMAGEGEPPRVHPAAEAVDRIESKLPPRTVP